MGAEREKREKETYLIACQSTVCRFRDPTPGQKGVLCHLYFYICNEGNSSRKRKVERKEEKKEKKGEKEGGDCG